MGDGGGDGGGGDGGGDGGDGGDGGGDGGGGDGGGEGGDGSLSHTSASDWYVMVKFVALQMVNHAPSSFQSLRPPQSGSASHMATAPEKEPPAPLCSRCGAQFE